MAETAVKTIISVIVMAIIGIGVVISFINDTNAGGMTDTVLNVVAIIIGVLIIVYIADKLQVNLEL